MILGHTPAGTSSRTVLHFAQGVQSGRWEWEVIRTMERITFLRFREFDFGNEEENMDEYGTPEPPEYR